MYTYFDHITVKVMICLDTFFHVLHIINQMYSSISQYVTVCYVYIYIYICICLALIVVIYAFLLHCLKEQAKANQEKKEGKKRDALQTLKSAIIVSGIIVAVAGVAFAVTKKLREK